jgi:hypothetical protein
MVPSPMTRRWCWLCLASVLIWTGLAAVRLQAAPVLETFTDHAAFVSALGPNAQVVNFDDVPTFQGRGSFEADRYANQGILIQADIPDQQPGATQAVGNSELAVSPPNVYFAELEGDFRDLSQVSFVREGKLALSAGFGSWFIDNRPFPGSESGNTSFLTAFGPGGAVLGQGQPGITERGGRSFLGLLTVDGVTDQPIAAISKILVVAGQRQLVEPFLDDFTFASPVLPVPEANAWVLLGATALGSLAAMRLRRCSAR